MSEIIVSLSGAGQFKMNLDLIDQPEPDVEDYTEVWRATFCDDESGDCQVVYFEMGDEYEAWDLIDEAIQTYRDEVLPENEDLA